MTTVKVIRNVLDANDRIAFENRELFDRNGIYVINLMSSPGAGKTSLVENTIRHFQNKYRIAVIEGDIQDTYDADRVAALGTPVVQINTGGGCHIDANMVREALPAFNLAQFDFIIVENVGNLVCPAEFKLGENAKIMILSVPEGADKPAKYPLMFQESAVLVINKTDLLPYVDFDMVKAKRDALRLNPGIEIFEASCKKAEGLQGWYGWLDSEINAFKKRQG